MMSALAFTPQNAEPIEAQEDPMEGKMRSGKGGA